MSSHPEAFPPQALPRHVAIIMDGNGRWARSRGRLRIQGHRAGVEVVRAVVEQCLERGVQALTLFAFSSENWGRPPEEVSSLMRLFIESLEAESAKLHRNGVRLRFIGRRRELDARLIERITSVEGTTAGNSRLQLQIAVSYGGRRDIIDAAAALAASVQRGELRPEQIDEQRFAEALALAGLPDPDLFIRTGGEQRLSNFLLWNLAYTELYFTELLWPDFDSAAFDAALQHFAQRQRRFGLTAEQVRTGRVGSR